MPSTVEWYIPDHVLLTRHIGDISVEDARQVNAETLRLLKESPAPRIHNIADFSEQTSASIGLRDIRDIISVFGEPNYGWTVIVGQKNHLTRFLLTATQQIFSMKLKNTQSIEEALQFLKTEDAALR